MSEFLESSGGLFAAVLVVVLAMNTLLMGVYKALEIIKDKTSGSGDNRAYEVIGKIISVAQRVIDLLSANVAHKK